MKFCNVGSLKEVVKMKILSERLIRCSFLSEHLLPEDFGHFISIQYSGNFKKLTGGFVAISLEEYS